MKWSSHSGKVWQPIETTQNYPTTEQFHSLAHAPELKAGLKQKLYECCQLPEGGSPSPPIQGRTECRLCIQRAYAAWRGS